MKILNQLPPEVKKDQLVAMDFETFGQEKHQLHRPTGIFACISVALEGDPNVYQLYDHHDLKKLVQVTKKGTWVFHNALYDLRQFRRFAEVKPRFIWDTMLADQSMLGGYYSTFSLADLSRRWLGEGMEKETREEFYKLREMTPQGKQYAAKDAWNTLRIAQLQRAEYLDDPAFKAYTVADEPMIFPLLDMPGIRVNVEEWTKMVQEFTARAAEIEDEIDLNVFAFAKVKDRLKKAGLHLPDTTNETLQEFIDNPLVAKIVEARMYRKASGTYGEKWLEKFVEADGKVYASYNITGSDRKGVATGRMSCHNPNMQNIPQRKLPQYRTKFIPSEGGVMEVWDVKQQEPCITAFHSQDARLLKAIRDGEDLHLAVAREIYNNPALTKADKEERGMGKIINLGLVYGLTKYGVAKKAGCSEAVAEKMLRAYFQKFSGVYSWIQSQRQRGYRTGFVTTALGRRSYLNLYDKKWENNAINSPIQGGAADFTKVWARLTWEQSIRLGIPFTVAGFIHDETVKDTPKEILRESQRATRDSFQEAAERLYPNVPFGVDMEVGRSWGAKSIEAEMVTFEEEATEEDDEVIEEELESEEA